ncbi:hypothetical protein ElyMa_003872900 [Elysia marginata]|uniref:ERAP1-like C-terminal domain-containing protein n=1 Tax=Elysia marginata TaxID=1093978 RepID=A0AAV4FK57_9GAST|nr:hypothetical protein ElyMa_003872900 [Elysia marginata]
MDTVDLLRRFLKADRSGNWNVYLGILRETFPFLAAVGHNLYTKVYLYLQDLLQLQPTNLDVFTSFQAGHHVLRRTDRFWAGLSSDLIIEQVLIRCVKATEGLTRGRGMLESQRSTWLLSMTACVDINEAMQSFTGFLFTTSEQHKDMTAAIQKKHEKT